MTAAVRSHGSVAARRALARAFVWTTIGLGFVGCGSDDSPAAVASDTPPPIPSVAPTPVAQASVEFIAIQAGAPETALWDDAGKRLFVIDNTGNKVWKWTDADGLTPFATLALAPDQTTLPTNVTLGQAALLPDGTLVINRFGQPGGGFGNVVFVRADGTGAVVPNLDATRRRIGLVEAGGTLYGSYFSGSSNNLTGFLTTIDIGSGETVVADGFGKIVGLAVSDGKLYVSDQSNEKIWFAPLGALPAHAADWSVLARFVKPDQICAGPDGSLFSGQFQGASGSTDPLAVRQIAADGTVTVFKTDPDVSKPSGLSYDPTHRRLFVADSGNSARIGVHVFVVP